VELKLEDFLSVPLSIFRFPGFSSNEKCPLIDGRFSSLGNNREAQIL
jgi:hypothetical protein